MLEELKYALFNINNYELHRSFITENDNIKFVYNYVIVHGTNDEIFVFYDFEEMKVTKQLKYIGKNNSLKTFDRVSSAMDYMKYLANVTTDIRYELYHYFMFKLKEYKIIYRSMAFNTVNNISLEEMMLRCDINNISIRGHKVKYNFIIIFKKDSKCKLSFYPENPLWDEGKDCPEVDVDKVIEYILNLKVDNYEDIPLIES